MAVDWPDRDELKALLDVQNGDFDDHLDTVLGGAIAVVKEDVQWVEASDVVTERLHNAALRAAIVLRPNAPGRQPGATGPEDVRSDPVYQSWIRGRKRRFSIA